MCFSSCGSALAWAQDSQKSWSIQEAGGSVPQRPCSLGGSALRHDLRYLVESPWDPAPIPTVGIVASSPVMLLNDALLTSCLLFPVSLLHPALFCSLVALK